VPAKTCRSILIVEDDRDIRETLEQLLRTEGYRVFAVANSREGIAALKRIPGPALVLLDLMTPVMNGWEFLEAQKSDHVLATLPVVVVSALASPSLLAPNTGHAEPAGFLKKPVSLDSLLDTVEQYCVPPAKRKGSG
jgi:CheY-like chemotaxis protein